ncbi:ATP-binding protein [Kovacikia minuta CCNUW1]|uniref:tetratricopeptide repeat protein n=1 Tax=Kovacikia minuta TaxID=2931930 RepID=UPI001CCA94F3|nr:tetratricopeptide repeat protein [Kovacikia minuta]UBF28515.1 ATP-binding protein [Kovacikia minuta CCNUW1]
MSSPKRNRARILTASGLKKLREQMRSHEVDENAGFKYTLERLGELTGLDPETVKNVLDCKGSDKRTIARCFETFGLTLAESDHIPAAQATTTADPNFVGRNEAIADLDTLVSRNARVIVIQARGGVGKTTLARKYLQQEFGSFLEFPIAKETKDIASIEGLLEEKLRQLGEEPGREFLVSLDRLKRKLQAERIGILIDNLEPALDSAGKFIEAHRRYVELLRVLSDPTVHSITLITSRERLREADVTVQHYPLRSLDVQAWSQFFQSRSINTDTAALAALHDAYGGNAKAMDIISGTVLEDFSGDVEAYWQANQDDLFIERDLEDLVAKQFDRLQELDPDAYKLLCRMGCYRYQDVATVPIEGLFCLLWDVSENRRRRVIKSLQDRSLVELEDGEFWLHPVVREKAIEYLKVSKSWETANCKAAEFWTERTLMVNTINDAIRALEAFYHYTSINSFDEAASVILKIRITKMKKEGSSLGYLCYRLGLLNQLTNLISAIIDRLNISYKLGELYFLLGDLKWLVGNLKEAIEYNEKSREIADDYSNVNLQNNIGSNINLQNNIGEGFFIHANLKIASLFNNALYKFCMLEIEEAEKGFKAILKDFDGTRGYQQHSVGCLYYLALLSTYKKRFEEAYSLAEQAVKKLETLKLLSWSKGYGPIILGRTYRNLGEKEKSFQMYQIATLYSQESGHILIQANSLSGLAELSRDQKKFEVALSHHSIAVRLLNEIGAKCDLAEAKYQLGLTYQAMEEMEKSQENFQAAIRLFSEMEAPKQVERVRRSMQN